MPNDGIGHVEDQGDGRALHPHPRRLHGLDPATGRRYQPIVQVVLPADVGGVAH